MPPLPCSSPTIVGKIADAVVMRMGELALSLAGCNTQKSGSCILHGQKGRAGPGCRKGVRNDLAPRA